METVAERLRREGTHVHEDTRGLMSRSRASRDRAATVADLRHVLGELVHARTLDFQFSSLPGDKVLSPQAALQGE